MTIFCYDVAIIERFPAIVCGVIHATGVRNGPAPAALAAAFEREQAAVIARIGATPLSEIPSLAAWRRVFRGFGVDPTQYRSAAEALLRRLGRGEASVRQEHHRRRSLTETWLATPFTSAACGQTKRGTYLCRCHSD